MLAALVLVVALGAEGTPADKALPIELGAYAGGNFFTANNGLGNSYYPDQVPRSSATLGLRGAWRFAPRFAVELELKYTPTSTVGNLAAGRPAVASSIFGPRLQATYTMFPWSALRPFVLVGGALEVLASSPPASYGVTSPDADFGVYWGLGGEYSLVGTRYGIRVDLRQGIYQGVGGVTFNYEALAGVSFDLFGHQGRERVALARAREAELHGSSRPLDSDGDGIADDVDRCPEDKEVPNGIDDDDGCPEVDSDGDGLLGSQDKCPDRSEDKDGFEDEDGCPDPDNDGDGIADVRDKCPMVAETQNGFEDEDGCADEVPEPVREFTGVVNGIEFDNESANIKTDSFPTLDRAVSVFRDYSELRIEISGHCDNTGDVDVNTALSRERADQVKWYLVDHGIDAYRIVTVGLGASKPIADNATPEGRAKNRRIEFRLLRPGE